MQPGLHVGAVSRQLSVSMLWLPCRPGAGQQAAANESHVDSQVQDQQQQQQLQQQEQQVGSMQQAGDADLDEGAFFHYAVTLQYDGTNYWGFQLQPMAPAPAAGQPRGQRSKPTIQLRLEQALTKLTGEAREALKVQAAGRTDTGVHARGQVAQFRCRRQLAPDSIQRALNSRLPLDIRAVAVEAVPADFNVRYALSKTYRCAGWVAGGRWE